MGGNEKRRMSLGWENHWFVCEKRYLKNGNKCGKDIGRIFIIERDYILVGKRIKEWDEFMVSVKKLFKI